MQMAVPYCLYENCVTLPLSDCEPETPSLPTKPNCNARELTRECLQAFYGMLSAWTPDWWCGDKANGDHSMRTA